MAVNQNGKRPLAIAPKPTSGGLFHHLSKPLEGI